VPADGIGVADCTERRLRYVKVFGPPTGKTLLDRTWSHGVPDVKNKRGETLIGGRGGLVVEAVSREAAADTLPGSMMMGQSRN
jgi:hypothetical protein